MLIDKSIPTYHYNEIHKRLIDGSAKECFLATKNLNISPSFITRFLLRLRGLPYKAASFEDFIKGMCFTYLEENPYQEFVIDASKSNLKIYWNFSFREVSPGKTCVATETRIYCASRKAKLKFSIYWYLIKPMSGYIRKDLLRLISKSVQTK